jgi:hypothetical protein
MISAEADNDFVASLLFACEKALALMRVLARVDLSDNLREGGVDSGA